MAERLEIHRSPEHGSWLNMAELEQSVMARQRVSRRIVDRAAMEAAAVAWYEERKAVEATMDWRFRACS